MKSEFSIPQRALPKQLGVPMAAIRVVRDTQLVKGVDWQGGKTCLFSEEGAAKLCLALALPGKTADHLQTAPDPEKPQRGPDGAQRGPFETPPTVPALVVFRCAPSIVNTRVIECHPYGEKPDPQRLTLVWVKPQLHAGFRPRQLIPPEHLRPYGVPGQWVYIAHTLPRRQV